MIKQPPRRSDSPAYPALSGTEAGLLEHLKAWRREEARVQGVPAYVIFHDSTLAQIARRAPQDLQGLSAIGGIGLKKLERYGEALLALLAARRLKASE